MAATTSLESSSLPLAGSPSSGNGNSSKDATKPFKIRSELLTPSRLAPKAQLLHHSRSLSLQVIAQEVFLLVLVSAKCFALAEKELPRIGILGGGSVGTTVVMTLLANGYRADQIALSTRQPDRIPRCEALKAPSALPLFQLMPRYYDNARLARESDVLVLCMPPAQLKSVTIQIRHALAANSDTPLLVISTLCGVTHQSLSKACGSPAVVRVQPDVAKIASQWNDEHEQQNGITEARSVPTSRLLDTALEHSMVLQNASTQHRDLQPLPLRLAVEALAPSRDIVCNLLEAFTLFCRRAWNQDNEHDTLHQVLFGEDCDVVMATLGENQQLQQQERRENSPLVVPNWPVEWEQDLVLLQAQLQLQETRSEGCSSATFVGAAANGHLEVLQWLYQCYPECFRLPDDLIVMVAKWLQGRQLHLHFCRPKVVLVQSKTDFFRNMKSEIKNMITKSQSKAV